MGAYKPRTSPYAFQGHGRDCLNYVFDIAGKHGIKVIAMEVTHESHVDGDPRGAARDRQPDRRHAADRHAQHAELRAAQGGRAAAAISRCCIKRGFGITLDESLNAAEYLASEGNRRVVFGLRGMKTHMGDPHRNFVDFAHVPVVKRLTRMPVCIDPSHSVGSRARGPDGILELMHVTAQGVAAGANMILVDFHPEPAKALVDGPQALLLSELPHFVEDVAIAREAYLSVPRWRLDADWREPVGADTIRAAVAHVIDIRLLQRVDLPKLPRLPHNLTAFARPSAPGSFLHGAHARHRAAGASAPSANPWQSSRRKTPCSRASRTWARALRSPSRSTT